MNAEEKPALRQAPDSAGWGEELFDRPGHLIRRCYQITMALHAEVMKDLGVTQLQYVVLRTIRHHPGESQRRLGELAGLDRTTVGWVVVNLENKGLLRRHADGADRRHKPLALSPLGERKLAEMEPRVHALQQHLLAPLDDDEKFALVQSLQKIVMAYNDYSRAPLRADTGAK